MLRASTATRVMLVAGCAVVSGWHAAGKPPALELRPASPLGRSRAWLEMLARKPFKGGRLDEFLQAGEAEARFGPNRYASISEDAWKIEVEQTQSKMSQQQSMEVYGQQKKQILADHALLALLGCAACWSLGSVRLAESYLFGAFLGSFYLVLKGKEVDSIGAASLEEVGGAAPPAVIVPVLAVLLSAKYKSVLMLLPVLAGLFTSKLATLSQLLYEEEDKGLAAREAR